MVVASRKSADRTTWSHQPEELIARDEKEQAKRGQDVSGTFHLADFFIQGWNREVIAEDLERTLEILFGSPSERRPKMSMRNSWQPGLRFAPRNSVDRSVHRSQRARALSWRSAQTRSLNRAAALTGKMRAEVIATSR